MTTHEDLTVEQAVEILAKHKEADLASWYAWREGMDDWELVTQIADLRPGRKSTSPPDVGRSTDPKPIPARQDDDGQMAFDFGPEGGNGEFEIYWMVEEQEQPAKANIHQLHSPTAAAVGRSTDSARPSAQVIVPQWPSGRDRRKYERVSMRLKVTIQTDNISIRTFTRDASLGGVALEAPVPTLFQGADCQIFITHPDLNETIRFSGRLLANRESSRYFSFFRASAESNSRLQNWLHRHLAEAKTLPSATTQSG